MEKSQRSGGAPEQDGKGLSRRTVLRATAATGTVLAAGGLGVLTASGSATAAVAGLPDYRYVRTILLPSQLNYNPTGEIIFPCIRGAAGRVPNPLARYYLYYAPHDAPGGICLAYSNSLEGPFTEYPGNPIFDRHFNGMSVSHVSSPDVIWNTDVNEMWLYFHGENSVTRLARSTDGINFTYDKAVLSTNLQPSGTTETSYARVHRYDLPSRNARYVMLFMGNNTTNRRYIGWGWSSDARNWTFDQTPLIRPQDVGSINVGGPQLVKHNGSTYVIYNQDKTSGGNMLVTEVGTDFSKRTHLGIFYDSMSAWPENGRAAAPSFGTMDGVRYMFYEAGDRLQGAIAMAREV